MRNTTNKLVGLLIVAALTTPALALDVTVTVENLAPENGTYLTPVWVGFHDGTFDVYDTGSAASASLERLAEDGNTTPLSDDFTAVAVGAAQDTIVSDTGIPPLAPGETATATYSLDGSNPLARYFSYASMVIPSNDAFIGNDSPTAHMVFSGSGDFLGADFIVYGRDVLDAGTEVNDEDPNNTAFFGQATPDTGVDENGLIGAHVGFMSPGSGGILDDPMFANADFTADGYELARITITPEPSALMLLGIVAAALRRRA